MGKWTQKNRPLAIDTPLGEDVLILKRLSGSEELGRPFRYELDLVSEQPEGVDFDKIISENVTIRLRTEDGDQRYFNGHVSQITHTYIDGSLTHYKAVVVPWLWFLTRTADCRIFQDMTVPDILKQVFRDHDFSDFDDQGLSGEYRTWDYCVQYRESAFDFVSRLMEQEGIYYFFSHEDGKHKLILADSPAAHEAITGTSKLSYHPPTGGQIDKPHVSGWTLDRRVLSGTYAVNDFDFTNPKKELKAKADANHDHPVADGEVYDYPGEYTDYSHAESYSKIRVEELHAGVEVTRCESNERTINAGSTYELDGYPIDKHNKKYLITSVAYELTSDIVQELGESPDESDFLEESIGYRSRSGAGSAAGIRKPTGSVQGSEPLYRCRFSAIDGERQFRSARITPQPHIRGPQTAIVVCPSGSEIHTDEYGRVKVQFHWDRQGNFDDQSSCWVRVSQNWAGNKWGGMFIPHKDQEVIVEFLEGDPDRPIITGRVYNADNMPPDFEDDSGERTGLPENKHKSIIRDDYGNQMIFDATPGDEHIWIHSPHHESNMILGKSIWTSTSSNDTSITTGNNLTVVTGFNHAIYGGIRTQTDLGFYIENAVGAKVTMTAGAQVNATVGLMVDVKYSREYEYNLKDFSQKSGGGMKFDSEESIELIAAPKDAAQLRMNSNEIVLEYQEKPGAKAAPVVPPAVKMALVGAGLSVPAAVAASALLEAYPLKCGDHSDIDGTIGEVGGIAIGALATLLSIGGVLGKEKDPETLTPDSQIVMNKDGAVIVCGNTMIGMDKDGDISIVSGDKNVLIESCSGNIDLIAAKKVRAKGTAFDVNGVLKHKNFEVLA